jgi:hypothetical protein
VAAKKTIEMGKETVPVCYLTKPYSHLHALFVQKYPQNKIALTTFRKYIPKNFTRGATKRTDMCHYCVKGEKAVQELQKITEFGDEEKTPLAEEIQKKIEKVKIFGNKNKNLKINFMIFV